MIKPVFALRCITAVFFRHAIAGLALFFLLTSHVQAQSRERVRLDAGWRFALGDVPTAAQPDFDARTWREVTLPHDWSIEGDRAPDAPSGNDGGYFPGGVGWYRRTLDLPARWRDQLVTVVFDGAYRRAEVWINGVSLGRHAYGYTPFRFDLTPHLRPGAANHLAVCIDASAQPGSRWFTGAGLTRHVWLEVTSPLRLAPDSPQVSTADLQPTVATLALAATLLTDADFAGSDRAAPSAPPPAATPHARIEFTVIDPSGLPVATTQLHATPRPGVPTRVEAKLAVPHVQPWSPETPALYRLVTRVFTVDGHLADRVETTFGIRTLAFSAARGFELNGRPIELVGANIHHDHGPLGGAAFDRAEERKAELLKAAGFNAVRTAHNPPAPAFLDACDRLGLLVIVEAFDGWAKKKVSHDYSEDFSASWRDDLTALVQRDRHHPSVIAWSIGNEVYERGDASGLRLARELGDHVRALDATRPVTMGLNGLRQAEDWPKLDPLFATLDLAGYNYELHRHAADHARVPARVMFSSESYLRDAFAAWAIAHDQPHVIGDFVWSGMDYLGESGIGRVFPPDEPARPHWEGSHYPWHGAACGDIDLIGQRRPISHYRAIVWDRGERLYAAVQVPSPDDRPWNVSAWAMPPAAAHWTWPGQEGRPLTIDVFSRHPRVRLYLGSDLVGEQSTTRAEEFRATFRVPYAPGTVRAVGIDDAGQERETVVLTTAEAPGKLRLVADRFKLRADGQDLAFITVEIVDAAGRLVPHAAPAITYTLDGPGTIAGIGSADLASTESYRANPRRAHEGRALVIVRTTAGSAGALTLTASATGLPPATLELATTR